MGDNIIEIKQHAILVKQRPHTFFDSVAENEFLSIHDFFILNLNSDVLLKVAKFLGRHESSLGIQRKHKEDRDKQIGNFISSDHPFFPNNIIINIPLGFRKSFYDKKTNILNIKIKQGSCYIIDGQHRLKAFQSDYSKGIKLPLVVSAYFGLEIPTIAEIFTRINFFQSPVSKSVVYDLLEFNKDPEFLKFRDAHYICDKLNSSIDSPFYNLIKMLGVGSGLLSQAAFVEAISTRYKIVPLLNRKMSTEEIANLISKYFESIKTLDNKEFEIFDIVYSCKYRRIRIN